MLDNLVYSTRSYFGVFDLLLRIPVALISTLGIGAVCWAISIFALRTIRGARWLGICIIAFWGVIGFVGVVGSREGSPGMIPPIFFVYPVTWVTGPFVALSWFRGVKQIELDFFNKLVSIPAGIAVGYAYALVLAVVPSALSWFR